MLTPKLGYAQHEQIVDSLANSVETEVIELRHWFHQNAELSNREFKTAARIAEELEKIGLTPQTGIAHTGVVAVLIGGKPGPVVALRADIDGLPVNERCNIPWASKMMGTYNGQNVPVMHACGHDTHIAILLGVAKIMTEIRDEIPGTIKFIFQPAEEGSPMGEEGGAELMVKEGVLKNPNVDAIFGLHISSGNPVGKISTRSGAIMASADSFRIDISGSQTHGSTPWTGIDPIITAAQMINSMQTIVSRNMELTKAATVITIGSIHGGVRSNIIPEKLYMLGTLRSLDKDMRELAMKRLGEIVEAIAAANGATATLEFDVSYPITYNDPELFEQMLPTFEKTAGSDNVIIGPAITGAEDFSFFQEQVPGLYFFLGGVAAGTQISESAPHHTPYFFVDDSGMLLGIKTMSNLTLDYMKTSGK
ncbi:MAG TPA: amidohydrolase [Flavobacteriales bacterium]|nr:amidohydrolase [Flavobacteriales bacterium]